MKSADCAIRVTSACILAMMSSEVPAGAIRPFHAATSKSGKPASATVGTSGKAEERIALVTASALILPALTCGRALATAGEASGIWLPIRSVIIWAMPL